VSKKFSFLVLIIFSIFHCDGRNPIQVQRKNMLLGWAVNSAVERQNCLAYSSKQQASRIFQTSFESASEFQNFYSVPQNYQNAATHGYNNVQVRSGTNSHYGTIYTKGPNCPSIGNCNHRGYPTIQLRKLNGGGFAGTVFVEFYAYLDMDIQAGQWFSFATFTPDTSDSWDRVVTVNLGNLNLGTTNYIHLMHVPYTGMSNWTFQTKPGATSIPFQTKTWTKISVCLNYDPNNGYAKVWQNDQLVSSAPVGNGCGVLEQAHFGLYAYPSLSSGTIYNDDLIIQEVASCPK
jgi:hypothetical protein